MNFSSLCTPAFLYFIVSLIYLAIRSFKSFNIMSIIFKMFFILLWSWFLNFLCSIGYSIISWILILLPFFVLF